MFPIFLLYRNSWVQKAIASSGTAPVFKISRAIRFVSPIDKFVRFVASIRSCPGYIVTNEEHARVLGCECSLSRTMFVLSMELDDFCALHSKEKSCQVPGWKDKPSNFYACTLLLLCLDWPQRVCWNVKYMYDAIDSDFSKSSVLRSKRANSDAHTRTKRVLSTYVPNDVFGNF